MKNKPFVPPSPHPEFKDPQQAEDFEKLFQSYYRYIYKYCVGYEEHFKPDKPWYQRNDFQQLLEEEGLDIKVNKGY